MKYKKTITDKRINELTKAEIKEAADALQKARLVEHNPQCVVCDATAEYLLGWSYLCAKHFEEYIEHNEIQKNNNRQRNKQAAIGGQ